MTIANGAPDRTDPAAPLFIVVTGGPGAGKTAVLEMAKRMLCDHVAVLPESASIIYGGGFWRLNSVSARQAAQRAIYFVQREMENLVIGEKRWSVALCDRGTLDGLAYWADSASPFMNMTQEEIKTENQRYFAVIHLRSPNLENGYNHDNPLRLESAREAQAIDEKMHTIWSQHERYRVIEADANFFKKAQRAIDEIKNFLPSQCPKCSQI